MSTKKFHILNASAGSGKTYRLVQEYIQLLIDERENHSKFSSIVAMTFTNKAALEMKERIIKALDEISSPEVHKTHELQLRNDLAHYLKISVDEVNTRCKTVLQNILHQYEEFHVMTIDKFNLRLIKSFSRDLDLPSDFEVVMDESEIIEKIVDQIIDQLGKEESSELNGLLLKYASANIDEGVSWNFRRRLVEFGSVLNKERNFGVLKNLLELNLSIEQYKSLYAQKSSLTKGFLLNREELQKALSLHELIKEDLPGGGNTINDINGVVKHEYFITKEDLIKGRLSGNIEKSGEGDKSIPEEILTALINHQAYWANHIEEFVAIELFLKNFFNIALLQYMAAALEDVKKGEQIIRISEFNSLISELIQDEYAPFIYERLGNKFDHFLLDEFQDTSHLQWLNLIPLIHESLGNNQKNLIVGDPKQSIYRFKNGIAEQFIELPGIYNPNNDPVIHRKSSLFKQMGQVDELQNNWRSSPVIVDFNNSFFDLFKSEMNETARAFYQSTEQSPMKQKAGKLVIQSCQEKLKTEDHLPRIIEQIDECVQAGFKESEICILGARNIECNKWALGLNDAGYKVVSSDSLLINSDLHVQLTIAFFKWRFRPSSENEMKRFAELYFRINKSPYEEYQKFIETKELENGKTYRFFNDKNFVQEHFGDYSDFFFKYENLYDLVQGFYRIMKYDELSNPYLHHLADVIYNYGQKSGPDLKGFIDEYEKKKNKIAVQIPESDDAIKIMTIHKSKGLEFPVVILPSIDFKLEVKGDFFVDVDDMIIYKKPSKNDILQPLKDLYETESAQTLIDCINLCYVAMTRPIERLYITNSHEKSNFGALFHKVLSQSELAKEQDGMLNVEIENGLKISEDGSASDHLFNPKSIVDNLWFPDIALQDNKELNSNDLLSDERQFGLQFHLLISLIDDKKDITQIMNDQLKIGEIDHGNVSRLKNMLEELFAKEEYVNILRDRQYVLNEQSILIDEQTVIRPDKVIVKEQETAIIDFKTGVPSKKDEKQILNYKQHMSDMGYPNISCFLFYSAKGELRQIS